MRQVRCVQQVQVQQVQWMWSMLEDRLLQALRHHPEVRGLLPEMERAVADEHLTPTLAVERILRTFGVQVPAG